MIDVAKGELENQHPAKTMGELFERISDYPGHFLKVRTESDQYNGLRISMGRLQWMRLKDSSIEPAIELELGKSLEIIGLRDSSKTGEPEKIKKLEGVTVSVFVADQWKPIHRATENREIEK